MLLGILCASALQHGPVHETWPVHETYNTYSDGEKTHCLLSSSASAWGHMIYTGAYIWKWKLCLKLQGPFRK